MSVLLEFVRYAFVDDIGKFLRRFYRFDFAFLADILRDVVGKLLFAVN